MALLGRLVRIRQMISNELLYGRDHLFFELRWALCYPHCEIVQFLGVGLEPLTLPDPLHLSREAGGLGVRPTARERRDRDQVIVLITDGEDHESYAEEAAKQAAERSIKIFTVGLGNSTDSTRSLCR